jgi:hypothetical protein
VRTQLHSQEKGESFARELLRPGIPFAIRDKNSQKIKILRKINENQSVNLLPTLEYAYNLCIEGKTEKAARIVSEIAGLLIASEIDLGSDFLVEIEIRNSMPKIMSQIRREMKANALPGDEQERKSA